MKLTNLLLLLVVFTSCTNKNNDQKKIQTNNEVEQDTIEIFNEKIETIEVQEQKLVFKKDTLYQFPKFDIQFHDGNYKLFYTDSTPPEFLENEEYYSKTVKVSDAREGSTNKIISFFLSIWENGVAVRDYEQVTKNLVFFDEETYEIHELKLSEHIFGNSDVCDRPEEYKFINDSIIEVKGYEYNDERSKYSYFKLEPNKTLQKLTSNRKYDFTKFIEINDHYFKGCFIDNQIDKEYGPKSYYYVTEHLNLDELDIMYNEILAEYGFIFKSEKWNQYFSEKDWYEPLHNDVEEMICDRDKINLSIISKAKINLEENEEELLNKQKFERITAG
jgi:hypothetical protein